MGRPRKSFVAGVIRKLDLLETFISVKTPEILAEQFLYHTLIMMPRPPWMTGRLRRSGAVYVGGRLVMTTEQLAAKYGHEDLLETNPAYLMGGSYARYGSRITGDQPRDIPLAELRIRKFRPVSQISSLRGTVSVIYSAPHAAEMHEWQGNFSDPLSGAHYISAKPYMAIAAAVPLIYSEARVLQ